MTSRYIPVSNPFLDESEKKYVIDALSEGAISGLFGNYITDFERDFSSYSDCSHGVATTSGTTALHLSVASLGISEGDEVLTSSLTNMATFFAILYQKAKPIPIDVGPDTCNINPNLLEEKITDKTKAIMVVHLFGHPCDMDPVNKIAEKHNLFVIEDCAEAHGALYKGRKVGSLSDAGCFSFYANKIITTGEGGMITTNNEQVCEKARSLRCLAFGKDNKFMHQDIGYNYRLTNLQSAIGCAQLEKIDRIIELKRQIAKYYAESLCDIPGIQLPVEKDYARNVYWMYHIVLTPEFGLSRGKVMRKLKEFGIETRESFIPYNMQDIFISKGWVNGGECPIANRIGENGFYIPSGPVQSEEELEYIVDKIKLIQREGCK